MTTHPAYDEALQAEACDWIVRLQAGHEADALAFDAWLEADPAHGAAYDAAVAVWSEFGAAAAAVDDALRERRAPRPIARRLVFAGGAIAAAAAAAFIVLPRFDAAPVPEAFVTARGEHRTLNLADGSRVELNAGTEVTVALARDARRVTLDEGQAVFDVARDPDRPFLIAAGDRTIRVVGTQFDVRRRDGVLAVTVARGVVEVRPSGDGQGPAFRLHPGQRLEHREGAATARVTAAAPDEVLAWRSGRLIYRDAPLSDVVADLNAQFATPIRIEDPALASAPVSGVFILDDEDAVIRRLALSVSAEPVRSASGVALRR